MRRDEHDKHNRKVARIQYASDCLLWWSRVLVRPLKVRWQPLHQERLHPPGSVGIIPPRIDVLTLTPGTLECTIFPPQRMDVDVTLIDVEEVVDIREHRHG
jgi:hypothetical protein